MGEMRLVVTGAGGRMGRSVVRAIAESRDLALAAAIEDRGSPFLGQDAGVLAGLVPNGITVTTDVDAALTRADAIIDFTTPAATLTYAGFAAARGLVHIIGTTGLSPDDEIKIEAAASGALIVKSGNMSLGVNLLAALVKRVAQTLDDEFDIEILEMHHNRKVDAPSGTALLLGARRGRGPRHRSEPALGAQPRRPYRAAQAGDIGFATLRGGTVVGDHCVIFAGPDERIELVHKAEDRMIFARGAVKAALWARGRKPGLYSMLDVLGLGDF